MAWGVNGRTSVLSAVLATLLAIHFGFTTVVVSAVILYGVAAASFPLERKAVNLWTRHPKQTKELRRMDIVAIQKAYRRYARLYDFYFGQVFQPGRKAVIQRLACQPGEKILEVGVGTGLSLPLYPDHAQLTGIDISPEMLERAQARVTRDGLKHVEQLRVMDAEAMQFPDNRFDKVVAMYVASVVPHPERLMDEMRRVCKPDGELYIVNHFLSDNPLMGGMERLISPLSKLIGFRPDLSVDDFITETDLAVVDTVSVNLFGYWTLLRARNDKRILTAPDAGRCASGFT